VLQNTRCLQLATDTATAGTTVEAVVAAGQYNTTTNVFTAGALAVLLNN
jgi:hypothetical protein